MLQYQICTLVTDHDQYAAMKSSFISCGFDEERCAYTVFDNSNGNRWDPYTVISEVLAAARAAASSAQPQYVVFCHQDVVLDQGHGIDNLTAALQSLDRQDPQWAVAGNSGVTDRFVKVVHVADPYGDIFCDQLPRRVLTLDENLLIIKPNAGLQCSGEMQGFHLYGTDLCLNALVNNRSVYVIDFKLTHKSGGNRNESFYAVQRRLQEHWDRYFLGVIVSAPSNTFAFSRFRWLRRVLNSTKATNFAVAHGWMNALLFTCNRLFLPFRRSRTAAAG